MSGKVNLDRWSPHLAAAKRERKTLTQYAREHGLSRHTLYAARQMLRAVSGEPAVRRRPRACRVSSKLLPRPAFAAVKLAPAVGGSTPRLQARLPNGVMLELTWEAGEPALLAAAIGALARR